MVFRFSCIVPAILGLTGASELKSQYLPFKWWIYQPSSANSREFTKCIYLKLTPVKCCGLQHCPIQLASHLRIESLEKAQPCGMQTTAITRWATLLPAMSDYNQKHQSCPTKIGDDNGHFIVWGSLLVRRLTTEMMT